MAPLAEFGLSELALTLLPDLTLTATEAAGLLGRLGVIAHHVRQQRADAADADGDPIPARRPARRR